MRGPTEVAAVTFFERFDGRDVELELFAAALELPRSFDRADQISAEVEIVGSVGGEYRQTFGEQVGAVVEQASDGGGEQHPVIIAFILRSTHALRELEVLRRFSDSVELVANAQQIRRSFLPERVERILPLLHRQLGDGVREHELLLADDDFTKHVAAVVKHRHGRHVVFAHCASP